ncbi:hypothetical protein CDL12_07751 [Handroanthus impetiginosus]|uniref:Uncharacterized protein n=1 Tax=Handroanthus impetiginosus TaxID=429701 RepID=A0A2G9HNE4_9LAMI|nr:hypothetical protein CDL12_08506 [Handroanthus impetiginosus]PIN19553.1 hypothetical protein CDL12_07751 [Handroanthus impetiginosus]
MEDSSLCGTSKSEGKDSEAISDSITSLGDHNATDDVSSTGPSDNQQNNEGDKTDDTTDVQKIPVEGHDIEEEEEEDEDGEEEDCISEGELLVQMGYAKSKSKEEIRKELERKSGDDEERREDDDNELPGKEPITASVADLKLVSSLKGSRKNEGKPRKVVTWSEDLEKFAASEDETETSYYQVKGAGKSKQKGGGKSGGESGSKSNEQGGRKGAGKNKKKGKKHGGTSSKWSNYGK